MRRRRSQAPTLHSGWDAREANRDQGRGAFNLFNVKAADYNYFEDVTFRNTDIAKHLTGWTGAFWE